jgi:hypothetical protein
MDHQNIQDIEEYCKEKPNTHVWHVFDKSPETIAKFREHIIFLSTLDGDFSLDKFLDDGALSPRIIKRTMNLELKVSELVSKYLLESPLSKNQKIKKVEDNWVVVTAKITDSLDLRKWLRNLGTDGIVLNPPYLVSAIMYELNSVQNLYLLQKSNSKK